METKKITKKEFKELHSTGQLTLLQSIFCVPMHEIIACIKQAQKTFVGMPVSNVHVESQGEHMVVTVYETEEINGQTFIIVQDLIDNSKSNQCSRNTQEENCIVYIKKEE